MPELERTEALIQKQKQIAERVIQSLGKLQEFFSNRSRPLHRGETSAFLANPHDDGHDRSTIALEGADLGIDAIHDVNICNAIDIDPSGDQHSISAFLRNQPTHDSSFRDQPCYVPCASGVGSCDSFPMLYLGNMSHDVAEPEHRQSFLSTDYKAGPEQCDSHPLWTPLVESPDLVPWPECRSNSDTVNSDSLINAPGAYRSIDEHDSDLDTSFEPVRTVETAPIASGSTTSSQISSGFTTANQAKSFSLLDSLESMSPYIRAANSAHRLPDGTLEQFFPGKWLNDLNIAETLRILLPLTAETLIASQAMQNYPTGSLARKWVPTDAPVPILRHSEHCTHLFIAYNVVYGTLDDMGNVRNNHWVLVAVDITKSKIHIFGVDLRLHEQGKLLADNIGLFLNNCRNKRDQCLIHWSDPNLQPVSYSNCLMWQS